MNTKTILAAIAGAVTYFLLGWLIYGMALSGFMEANTVKYEGLMYEMPKLGILFTAHVVLALLIAWIYDKWSNSRSFGTGFKNGLIIGFLFSLSMDLSYYAFMNLYNMSIIGVDVLVTTFMTGAMGGVIGAVLGSSKAAG